MGLYWDYGKENGNYRDYRVYIGLVCVLSAFQLLCQLQTKTDTAGAETHCMNPVPSDEQSSGLAPKTLLKILVYGVPY